MASVLATAHGGSRPCLLHCHSSVVRGRRPAAGQGIRGHVFPQRHPGGRTILSPRALQSQCDAGLDRGARVCNLPAAGDASVDRVVVAGVARRLAGAHRGTFGVAVLHRVAVDGSGVLDAVAGGQSDPVSPAGHSGSGGTDRPRDGWRSVEQARQPGVDRYWWIAQRSTGMAIAAVAACRCCSVSAPRSGFSPSAHSGTHRGALLLFRSQRSQALVFISTLTLIAYGMLTAATVRQWDRISPWRPISRVINQIDAPRVLIMGERSPFAEFYVEHPVEFVDREGLIERWRAESVVAVIPADALASLAGGPVPVIVGQAPGRLLIIR